MAMARLNILTPEQYMAGMEKAERQAFVPTVSLVYNIGQFVQDLIMKKPIVDAIDEVKGMISDIMLTDFDVAYSMQKGGPTGDVVALKETIQRIYEGLYENWKAGVWRGMGTGIMGAMETFLGSGQLIYAYKTLMYNTAVLPYMRRHWNSVFTPNYPDAAMAWRLLKFGQLKTEDFENAVMMDGWAKEWMPKLDLLFKTWPDAATAHRWWRHGLIADTQRDFYYGLAGWDKGIYKYITDDLDQHPAPRQAFLWNNLGLIAEEMKHKYYETAGWDPVYHSDLDEEFQTRPDAWGAFRWWRKGLIKEEDRNRYWGAAGWDSALFSTLEQDNYWNPSIYELARIADYIELDQTWAIKKLKAAGASDADAAKIWPFIQLRPLREEVRGVTTEWVWRYRYGRTTYDELSAGLDATKIKAGEKALLMQKAQMQWEDELVNEWIEVYTWRFRTARITEDEFYEDILALGVRAEKANAIVELEKAKGYTGGYAYS